MQSNDKQSKAMQNHEKQSKEQSNAKQCNAKQCKAKQCKVMQYSAKQCKAMQSNHDRFGSREYDCAGCTFQHIVKLMEKIGCQYYDESGYCSWGCYPEYVLCHKFIRNECTRGSRCKYIHVEDTTGSRPNAYTGSASSSRSSNHCNTIGSSTDTSSSW